MNKVVLLYRYCNERTKDIFLKNNIDIIKPICLYTFNNQPFYKTFCDMLQSAIHIDADYFLTLDADLIVTNINPFLAKIGKLDYLDCFVYDKFRGSTRGGMHMYSRRMIQIMWRALKDVRNTSLFYYRPEGACIRRAYELEQIHIDYKINKEISREIVAFHDYCQFRSHLFYKYIHRGWRLNKNDCRKLLQRLHALMKKHNDIDYLVAINAMEWARQNPSSMFSGNISKDIVEHEFSLLGIPEKFDQISNDELKDTYDHIDNVKLEIK